MNIDVSRRSLLTSGMAALALGAVPDFGAFAQTAAPVRRLEWGEFRWNNGGADYNALLRGIQVMRANTNAADPMSWTYWSNVHRSYCPHGTSYFLAWHRGYLYHFERQLRRASGNSNWSLPYWDYYKHPGIPPQFADPSTPLHVAGRTNTNVYPALTLAPFSSQYTGFQRGTANSYEAFLESRPHNPVHNLIGGYMADMQAPMDPIFWLHHAGIDRMWAAWAAAGGGRRMPDPGTAYWNGSFTYAPRLTMPRRQTYDTVGLGYIYTDMSMPSSMPPQAAMGSRGHGRIARVGAQFDESGRAVVRPLPGRFTRTPPRATGSRRRSLGGAKDVLLDDASVSAQIVLESGDSRQLQTVLETRIRPSRDNAKGAQKYDAVKLVLDDLRLTDAGKKGGFFYQVFINLPPSIGAAAADRRHLLGTVGAFEISGAAHHGMTPQLEFDVTELLAGLSQTALKDVTVSLVRVSGDLSPRGPVVYVGEVRLELVAED